MAEEKDTMARCHHILQLLLVFAERNPGITRILNGDALLGEHDRLRDRISALFDKLETQLKQALDEALAQAKAGAQPGQMDVFTGTFSLYPRYGKDQKVLGPYAPAFRSMVANLTTELTYQDLAGPGSMTEMGGYIEYTLNDYLTQQGLPQRINGVMFEDWLLLM